MSDKYPSSLIYFLFILILGNSFARTLEPNLKSNPKTLMWGTLQMSYPAALEPGDAFTLHFVGRGASKVRVKFSDETEVFKTQTLSDHETFVLGRVPLEATLATSLELIGQYSRQTVPLPLEVPQKEVQPLGFSKEYFLDLNKNRAAENIILDKVFAARSPRAWTEPFLRSSKGRKASGFGIPRMYTPGTPISFHTGIDFSTPAGTPIYASNVGKVAFVRAFKVRGNMTAIDHGLGLFSLYFHQSKILVKEGDTVQRGQKIGEVGTTGLSTAPHLHLEFRLRGVPVQPLEFLGRVLP